MRTQPPLPHSSGSRRFRTALALAALLAASSTSAVLPPSDPGDEDASPVVATLVEQDPYFSFLASLEQRSAACKHYSLTLRQLLSDRELLTRRFLAAAVSERDEIAAKIANVDAQITHAETALAQETALTQPADAESYVAPAPVDLERLRTQARRSRRPVYAPLPKALTVPELAAPTHEAHYVGYLAARAGDSPFAQKLVGRVDDLLHERRELAWRHAHASAAARADLESMIRMVSQHISISAEAAAERAVVTDW